jgi:two-component system sensor histidine kinase YesM
LTNDYKKNIDRLFQLNVNRTRDNLEILLSSYEDILYQVYTDDELIIQLARIDNDPYLRPVNINQIRRRLQALSNIKDWIEAITIITSGNNVIYYDRISASFTISSWLGSVDMTRDDIYASGISSYSTIILPTHSTNTIAKPNYLFHLLHRIIDYRNIEREIGIVVLTINEEFLSIVCNSEKSDNSFVFIVDKAGRIISYPDKTKIGTQENSLQKNYTTIYISESLKDWKVVLAVDQGRFHSGARYQAINVLAIGLVLLILTSIVILIITSMLSRSLWKVTKAMKQAEDGNLSASINENDIFPMELKDIAKAFNSMMERILALIKQIDISFSRKRDAEIRALEAQINPHFLYNILDNINWIVIEKEQYEISKMIVSLAKMMRYSIDRSNETVTLEDDISWLKQYINLQKIRFKNNFDCIIDVDSSLLHIKIYKLILQPFIENAIIHGFKNRSNNLLQISIWAEEKIFIKIQDNGNGIRPEIFQKIKSLTMGISDVYNEGFQANENHIGLTNAISRIRMYYGDNACVQIESKQDEGTIVTIVLTRINNENCSS